MFTKSKVMAENTDLKARLLKQEETIRQHEDALKEKDRQLSEQIQKNSHLNNKTEALEDANQELHKRIQLLESEKEEFLSSLSDISSVFEEITATSHEISDSANTIANQVGQSSKSNEKNISTITDFHNLIGRLFESVQELVKHGEDIHNITATINSISNETNLLSLNATIEAARAGEYGKGFSVVADEIRKLSDESKMNSQQIQQIVKNVSKVIEVISESVKIISKDTAQFKADTETRAVHIKDIFDTVDKQNYSLGEMAKALENTALNLQSLIENTSND